MERSLRALLPPSFLVVGLSAAAAAACYGVYLALFKPPRIKVNRSVALHRHNSVSLDGASTIEFTRRVFTEEEFVLTKIDRMNADCKVLRFTRVGNGQALQIPVAQHVAVIAEIGSEVVSRPYTPIRVGSSSDPRGWFEIFVKRYELGKMSVHLHQLEVGRKVRVRHPVGNFRYEPQPTPSELVLIGAGSGLTPLLRIIRTVLSDPEDATVLKLLYQNRSERDILAREELETMATNHPGRLHLTFALSNPPPGWEQEGPHCVAGHFNVEHLRGMLPAPAEGVRILICGPAGFNQQIEELLKGLGYDWSMIKKL